MIVIATHNGKDVIKNLLLDIKSFNIPNNEICIVDNKSSNSYISYLMGLKYMGYKVLLNPIPSYMTGAFRLAIDTFKSDVWFCLQDSIRIKQNIFEQITPLLTDKNVYTFLTFNSQEILGNPGVREFINFNYHMNSYKTGLFGVMFFAKDSVVQQVKNDWIIPKNKWEDASMEIGIGLVFEKYNIEIIGMDVYDGSKINIYEGSTVYPFFDKICKKRQ